MSKDFQEAFHGSAKLIKTFSLDHLRTGQDSLKFGHGVYFSSSAKTADNYRANMADGMDDAFVTYACETANGDVTFYEPDDDLYHAARAIHQWEDYGVALEEAEDSGDQELIDLLDRIGEVIVTEHFGAVYQVRIPSTKRLLDWDGAVELQNVDLMAMVRDLYGEDKLEHLSERIFMQASEEFAEHEFDEVFEMACTQAHSLEVAEKFREVCPDYPLDNLKAELGHAHIESDEYFTGGDLYSHLSHALGGADKASEYLVGQGIPGCYTKDTFMTDIDQQAPDVFTVWDMSELKILRTEYDTSKLINDELVGGRDSDEPGMDW